MDYRNILFTVEEGVAMLTFNRPKALNAMNSETIAELSDAVSFCGDEEAVKVLVLTGAGEKAFVAGADISQMRTLRPQEALAFMEQGQETLRRLETLAKPVIAAVNGYALGGGTEIALASDIRFASEKALFGQPEILIGLIPGWGGTQRLTRIVGMGRAKEMILSGAQIDAKRAFEIGLVNRLFPPEQLLGETVAFARKLAALPGFALKMAKHSINFGADLPLDNACRIEAQCCAQCFSTDDQKEGMGAFLEKRKPLFQGR
ncbi:MAG: enoyl-CoA hydratase/isomerase family protein [Syntrophales bacterium]